MTTPEVEGNVRQLDNEVQSIYDLLDAMSTTQRGIAATQQRHGNRLDELAAGIEGLGHRVEALENRFEGLASRFERLEDRVGGLDDKVEGLAAVQAEHTATLDGHTAKLDEILVLLRDR